MYCYYTISNAQCKNPTLDEYDCVCKGNDAPYLLRTFLLIKPHSFTQSLRLCF